VKLYLIIAVQLFDLFCSLTHQRFQFTHVALKQLLRLHVFLPQLDEVLSIMQTTVQKCTLRLLTLPLGILEGLPLKTVYDTTRRRV